ncbi:hypothetical protein BT69DRAFT_1297145 [Atractiella rhizophila]|nr:hypothetical protein BT69DRAFT_1297145 [Atractiella rhizophila]
MTMNLSFDRNRPFAATVLDSATSKPLFNLSHCGFTGCDCTMTIMEGHKETIFAEVKMHSLKKDMISLRGGSEMPLKNVLHGSKFSMSTTVQLPDGSEATWKESFGGTLRLQRNGKTIAESHRKHYITSKSRYMNIDIMDPSICSNIDNLAMVVLSFAILEQKKRNRNAAAGANASAGSSVAAATA